MKEQSPNEWSQFLWVLLAPGLAYLLGLLIALPIDFDPATQFTVERNSDRFYDFSPGCI